MIDKNLCCICVCLRVQYMHILHNVTDKSNSKIKPSKRFIKKKQFFAQLVPLCSHKS